MAETRSDRPARLTVVSAPAGYGKTSFAGQWFRALKAESQSAAWVSLDREDCDPLHLLQHLLRAIEQSMGAMREAEDLDALSSAALMQILRRLLGKDERDLVLFLDDYHLAQTDPTESAVFRLCSDPALERLRLVLISRGIPSFPLANLKLEGRVRMLGVNQLRFSMDETRALFGIAADPTDETDWIGGLLERTEGWAVALQMARVLSEEAPNQGDIWQNLKGRNADMGRYLIERVMSKLPEPFCRLLRVTAVLPAVSEDLASAVMEEPGTREHFAGIAECGLPIFVQDSSGHWVRYHPLLRDFLLNEAALHDIDADDVLERAATWFRDRGDIQSAVQHALLRQKADLAMAIVEAEGGWRLVYLTKRGGMAIFRRLSECVGDVPLERYPLTTLGLAVLHAKMGQLQSARHYLHRVTSGETPGPVVERHCQLVHALLSLYDDSRLSPAELTALEYNLRAEQDLGMVHHGLLLNLLCFNHLNQGRLQPSIAYGEQSLRCLKDCGAEFGALHLHIHIGQARYMAGDSIGAEASYHTLIADSQAHLGPGSDMHAIGLVLLSEVLVQRGHHLGASEKLDWALPHVERNDTWFDILAAGLVTRLRIALTEGQYDKAHEAIDSSRDVARRRSLGRLRDLCDAERVRVLIAQGEPREARRVAELAGLGPRQARVRGSNTLADHLRGQVPALLWTRLWLAQGAVDRAQAAIDWLLGMQSERLTIPRFVELRTLALRIALARGHISEAAGLLAELAFGASPSAYRGSILEEGPATLDQIRQLCARGEVSQSVRGRTAEILDANRAERQAGPREQLTLRERDVMALLPSGHSNKEIGRLLGMSESTVKFHLKNIFGKLGVSTRVGAVSAAYQASTPE